MDYFVDCVKIGSLEMDYMKMGYGPINVAVIPGISITKVTNSSKGIYTQFKKYLDRFSFYVFDRKRNMTNGYSVDDMADDTVTVMKHLGINRLCLYGTSQGGMISQIIASRYPEMIDKAAIICSYSRMCPSFVKIGNEWRDLARKGDVQTLNKCFLKNLFSDKTFGLLENFIESMNKNTTKEDLERFILQIEASHDTDNILEKIKCPVFVMGAYQDKLFGKEESEFLAEKLNCRIKMFDYYGHAMFDENPDVLKYALDFFEEENIQ